jgi:5-methylcytosine-specific restriction endonuclease McrA
MTSQTELLKSQFAVVAKAKAANFRNNCLGRVDKLGIDRANVPMPIDFYNWLLTYEEKIEVIRKQLCLKCEYTGELIKLKDIQIDHRTPISRGGSFGVENLAITSGKTNQYKGELVESEFLELLGLLNKFDAIAKNSVLSRLRSGGVYFRK